MSQTLVSDHQQPPTWCHWVWVGWTRYIWRQKTHLVAPPCIPWGLGPKKVIKWDPTWCLLHQWGHPLFWKKGDFQGLGVVYGNAVCESPISTCYRPRDLARDQGPEQRNETPSLLPHSPRPHLCPAGRKIALNFQGTQIKATAAFLHCVLSLSSAR